MADSVSPEGTTVSAHYQGEAGERYVDVYQRDAHLAGYRFDAEDFFPYLKPTDVVLDFGCGNGGLLRHFQARVARVDGLEVNPAARAIAQESGATVYAALDELPAGAAYSVILSNHVLEHIRDVPAVLERLGASLEPGGLLLSRLPVDDPDDPRQRSWGRGDVNHHLHTWTPRLFANVLYESGYEVEESRIIAQAWHPKLFWTARFGLHRAAFWLMSKAMRRRSLLAVGRKPAA